MNRRATGGYEPVGGWFGRRLWQAMVGVTQELAHDVDRAWRLAPLGLALAVELAGAQDCAALAVACRHWEGVPEPGARELSLRVEVDGGLAGSGSCVASTDGPVLRLCGPGVAGFADAAAGQAVCRISADYFSSPEALCAEVLEPLVLYLVCRSDRVPVHASAFRFGDLAVLLAGRSGSGKSCLALAADSAGLAVISDDTIYLQSRPRFRVWGWPGPAHVLPANAPAAPALASRWRNGTLKFVVPLASDPGVAAVGAPRAVLCILERGDRVALERLPSLETMRRLEPLEPGFDLMTEEIRGAHAALAAKGAWLLTLSSDPDEAIRLLTANLPRLAEVAAP